MKYLDIEPVKGEFYVFNSFKGGFRPPTEVEIDEQHRHNIGASKMILDGPFETLQQAMDARKKFVGVAGVIDPDARVW